jgi:hypothetical protein
VHRVTFVEDACLDEVADRHSDLVDHIGGPDFVETYRIVERDE